MELMTANNINWAKETAAARKRNNTNSTTVAIDPTDRLNANPNPPNANASTSPSALIAPPPPLPSPANPATPPLSDPFSHLDPRNVPLELHATPTQPSASSSHPSVALRSLHHVPPWRQLNGFSGWNGNVNNDNAANGGRTRGNRNNRQAFLFAQGALPFANPAQLPSSVEVQPQPQPQPQPTQMQLPPPAPAVAMFQPITPAKMPLPPLPPPPPPSPPHPMPVALAPVALTAVGVTSDEVMKEWKEIHVSWSSFTQQNRQKRESEERKMSQSTQPNSRQPVPLTRMGGTPILSSSAIEISEPPMLFNPASMGMIFNLLMGGSGGNGGGGGGGGPFPFFHTSTETIRSHPSGHASQILMMSHEDDERRPARMVFNDRRLDAAASSGGRGHSNNNPFATGNASSRWGELFRAAAASSSSASAASTPVRRANPDWAQPLAAAAAAGDSLLRAVQNRSLYDMQPRNANLRNGGSTLILLANPPPVSETENCTICMDSDRNQTWALLPCCKNALHTDCAKRCLVNDMRCPICRTPVP